MIPCFLIEPTGVKRITVDCWWGKCPQDASGGIGHQFRKIMWEGPASECESERGKRSFLDVRFEATICDVCGLDGGVQRVTSAGSSCQWLRRDTGQVAWDTRDFGAGAMYFAYWWYSQERNGQKFYGGDWDNQTEPPLHVVTPAGEWNIDSRARNCTMPEERTHRCWVRTGTPPKITVGKNGFTCGAGAGSILLGSYHGFLRDGCLVTS